MKQTDHNEAIKLTPANPRLKISSLNSSTPEIAIMQKLGALRRERERKNDLLVM